MQISSASLKVTLNATATKTVGQATASLPLAYTKSFAFTNGTGAAQADLLWQDSRSLADAATETLDLVGSLTDAFGDTFSPARIKAIVIENTSTDATLIVGNAASNQFLGFLGAAAHTLRIPPGAVFVLAMSQATAMAITGGSTDSLKMTHDGTGSSALVYKISVLAASA